MLITGASRGLGLQLAHAFAEVGCWLAICARDQEELLWAQQELVQACADVLAVPCNVSDEAQVQHLVETVTAHYQRIDILVNNAGVIDVGPLQNARVADFEHALDVIYWGTLHTIAPASKSTPQPPDYRGRSRPMRSTSVPWHS